MEKAKSHHDAKKQQNQELLEKLKAMEHLQKENTELQSKSEKLAKELQQSILQAKESEMSCKNLTSQIHSLETQVGMAHWGFTLFALASITSSLGGGLIHPFLPVSNSGGGCQTTGAGTQQVPGDDCCSKGTGDFLPEYG